MERFELSNIVQRLRKCRGQHVKYYVGSEVHQKNYEDIATDVECLCEKLHKSGVQAGDCIGILANNCYEWIVWDLAIQEIQGVCVAIPAEHYSQQDKLQLAERFDLVLLVVDSGTRDEDSYEWIADISNVEGHYTKRVIEEKRVPTDPDLMSLSFSSGTSGKIKCLKISRHGTELMIESFGQDFKFHSNDAIIAFLPLATIQQRWMLYATLCHKFNLHLCTPARLFQALEQMKPTIVAAAPLLFETIETNYLLLPTHKRLLADFVRYSAKLLPEILRKPLLKTVFKKIYTVFGGNVRFFLAGAAAHRVGTLKFFASIGLTLYEGWGITEAGFLSWNYPGCSKLGSVGKEVYKGALTIEDDGEIVVHHDHLPCTGYFDIDPEEERQVFPEPGTLATGDLGYFDSEGFLYIIGRKKDMIVTRGGFKIQPAEIEKEISLNPLTEHAVVMGGDDLHCLMAVVSVRGKDIEAAKISIKNTIEEINKRRPAPARVERIIFSDEPFTRENKLLNRNLKVDRNYVHKKFITDMGKLKRSPA